MKAIPSSALHALCVVYIYAARIAAAALCIAALVATIIAANRHAHAWLVALMLVVLAFVLLVVVVIGYLQASNYVTNYAARDQVGLYQVRFAARLDHPLLQLWEAESILTRSDLGLFTGSIIASSYEEANARVAATYSAEAIVASSFVRKVNFLERMRLKHPAPPPGKESI